MLGIGYLTYAIYVYYTEGVQNGVVICETGGACFRTMHVHADVEIEICGEQIKLPLEKGSLDGPHTHKERNKIHFEGKPAIDTVSKQLLDISPLKLGTFMQVMGVRFDVQCLDNKCNGDLCDGKPGMVGMFVNGKENKEFQNYVWKDGDQIVIRFA